MLAILTSSLIASPAQAVEQPVTQPPLITATAIKNDVCSVRIVGLLPTSPLSNSTRLTIAVFDSTTVFTLRDYEANELIDLTLDLNNVLSFSSNPAVLSTNSTNSNDTNSCGKSITAILSYQNGSSPSASASASVQATYFSQVPSVTVKVLNDLACSVSISGVVPKLLPGTQPYLFIHLDDFGYKVQLKQIVSGEVFTTSLSLLDGELIQASDYVANYLSFGNEPRCDSSDWLVSLETSSGLEIPNQSPSVVIRPQLPNNPVNQELCQPGTYSNSGQIPCTDSTPGNFVAVTGATAQIPCGLGYFSDLARSISCYPAPIGFYVGGTGSTFATPCPEGITRLSAARSIYECYKLLAQTSKTISFSKAYKFGAKVLTVTNTDAGLAMSATAMGKCTVNKVTVSLKAKGKTTKVDRFQVTTGKSAGTCTVTYSRPGDDTRTAMLIVKTFKVSKTGK